jgi:hypothetical protein
MPPAWRAAKDEHRAQFGYVENVAGLQEHKPDEESIRSAFSTADRIIKAGREEPQEEQE